MRGSCEHSLLGAGGRAPIGRVNPVAASIERGRRRGSRAAGGGAGGALKRPGVRRSRWQAAREELNFACAELEHQVQGAAVDVKGPLDGEPCTAFGQWVVEPQESTAKHGQHGIYGTAAGLEILAGANEPDSYGPMIAAAWSYLHQGLGKSPKRMSQFYIVLRQAMVLRSLAKLDWAIRNWDPAPPGVEREEVRALAGELLEELADAKHREGDQTEPQEVRVDWLSAMRKMEWVEGYRFASTSPDAPNLATNWAFHQAAVLNAVAACFERGLLDDPAAYLTKDHVRSMVRWCNRVLGGSPPDPVAMRVALFAGCAVLGLDEHREGGAAHGRMAGLLERVDERERRQMDGLLRTAIREVLADPALQTDLHLPFIYRFRDERGGADVSVDHVDDPYRQEHLVVPTVPTLLSLGSRLSRSLAFEHRYFDLTATVIGCLRGSNPTVVPAQATAANGTVNMAYLRNALIEVAETFDAITGKSWWWRLRRVIARRWPSRDVLSSPWFWAAISAAIGWGLAHVSTVINLISSL